MVKRTFIVHYEQWLEQDADALGWSEHKEITVRLTSDALTSGWLLQFGDTPLDYLVLTVISLHARPINEKDVEWLSEFGLATTADLGRMFSYATDMTIAAELGIHRNTVAVCAERLAENNNLIIRSMDGEQHNQLRQGGNFKGKKIYIIAGDVALKKGATDLESHRAGWTGTVESDRAGSTGTVIPQDQPTVPVQQAHRAGSTGTNIRTVDVVVGETERVFARFLERKGNAYEFTEKDRRELDALIADGYSLNDILRGIDAAFALPSKPQRFVQCVRVTRQRFSPSGQAETQTPVIRSTDIQTPVIRPTDIQTPEVKVASAELGNALALFERIIATPPSAGDAQKLAHLAALCDEAAQKARSSGVLWLEEALELTLTAEDVKSPIRYAESILRAWINHGKDADLRPARDGYRPPRRDSTVAPANPPAGANGNSDDSDPYRVIDPPLLPLPEQ